MNLIRTDRSSAVADRIVISVPAVDNIGHEHGSDGAEYRDSVAKLDDAIGEVLIPWRRLFRSSRSTRAQGTPFRG